jgi:hypothetical protein
MLAAGRVEGMTDLTVDDATGPKANLATRIVPPTRYRDPGHVLHLFGSAAVLLTVVAIAAIFSGQLLGRDATVATGAEPDTAPGRL